MRQVALSSLRVRKDIPVLSPKHSLTSPLFKDNEQVHWNHLCVLCHSVWQFTFASKFYMLIYLKLFTLSCRCMVNITIGWMQVIWHHLLAAADQRSRSWFKLCYHFCCSFAFLIYFWVFTFICLFVVNTATG